MPLKKITHVLPSHIVEWLLHDMEESLDTNKHFAHTLLQYKRATFVIDNFRHYAHLDYTLTPNLLLLSALSAFSYVIPSDFVFFHLILLLFD